LERGQVNMCLSPDLNTKAFGTMLTLLVCLSAAAGPSPVSADVADPPLRLEMSLEKREFLVAEPIWIDVSLTNTGTDTMWFPETLLEPMIESLKFLVIAGDDTVPYEGIAGNYCGPPVPLAPGAVTARYVDLLEYYSESAPGTAGFERYLRAGTYSIQAVAYGVTSETVIIEVSEPTGRDLAIHTAIHDAMLLKIRGQRTQAADLLLPLLDEIPVGNPYRERLEYSLNGILCFDKKRLFPMLRRFLSANPETRYARLFMLDLISPMSGERALAFADSVAAASPGTRLAKQAKELSLAIKSRR
jgi:hypothetical protein